MWSFEGTKFKRTEVTLKGKSRVFSVAFVKQKITALKKKFSSIAQSVEHAAVNRAVVGSSPTRGVKNLLSRRGTK